MNSEGAQAHKGEEGSRLRRLIAFLIFLGASLVFGTVLEHVLSAEGQKHLREVQLEAMEAADALQPWQLIGLYGDALGEVMGLPSQSSSGSGDYDACMAQPPACTQDCALGITCPVFGDRSSENLRCSNRSMECSLRNFERPMNRPTALPDNPGARVGLPVVALMITIENLLSNSWVSALYVLIQLFLGGALTFYLLTAAELKHPFGWLLLMPLGTVLLGSLTAIPVKWLLELGLLLFGQFLSIAGWITQTCTLCYGAYQVVHKTIELKFDKHAEEGISAALGRLFR